jgi:hypothetical protein
MIPILPILAHIVGLNSKRDEDKRRKQRELEERKRIEQLKKVIKERYEGT